MKLSNLSNNPNNQLLIDVVYIRLLLVVLVVFYHSFAVYSGAWILKFTPPYIAMYEWLDRLSYSCMLESFVFISGYVIGFQLFVKHKGISIRKKVKRRIVPSIFFSFLYWLCFKYNGHLSISLLYDLVAGVGHLWFLPMLFWCFVFLKLICFFPCKYTWFFFVLSLLLALFSNIILPFRINQSLYYFPFFYFGYIVWQKSYFFQRISNKVVLLTFLIYLFSFVLMTILMDSFVTPDEASFMTRMVLSISRKVCQLFMASVGVWFMFLIMNIIRTKKIKTSDLWINLSSCCFGVYIIQQFILMYCYTKTDLPYTVNIYLLPWLLFLFALVFSVFGAYILRQTKIGKKYL